MFAVLIVLVVLAVAVAALVAVRRASVLTDETEDD